MIPVNLIQPSSLPPMSEQMAQHRVEAVAIDVSLAIERKSCFSCLASCFKDSLDCIICCSSFCVRCTTDCFIGCLDFIRECREAVLRNREEPEILLPTASYEE